MDSNVSYSFSFDLQNESESEDTLDLVEVPFIVSSDDDNGLYSNPIFDYTSCSSVLSESEEQYVNQTQYVVTNKSNVISDFSSETGSKKSFFYPFKKRPSFSSKSSRNSNSSTNKVKRDIKRLFKRKFPSNGDTQQKELYLTDEEFFSIFKMTRSCFEQLTSRKQLMLRMQHKAEFVY